ncbi:LacI family DNA-binding transcriptional regulator [Streptomyces sp. ODS28]|uniref:LacI family DNA-binding transcriptional regulator n=1 Tax=Streptomyces sp. ODS28 TaxID=3136688 RepID=UPI0031EE2F95
MSAVRLKDVADRAGVSVKTVSNVVRELPGVSSATRESVLRAVEELGYRPNSTARGLRTGRSGLIALAVPDLAVPYFAELAQHVRLEAARVGLTLLAEETSGSPEEERRLAAGLGSSMLDGVILSPLRVEPAELAEITEDFPLVLLGERSYAHTEVRADHVLIDNVAAAREATAHLASLGRTRIAAIGAQQPAPATSRQRLEGFQLALHDAGLTYDPRLTATVPEFDRASGLAAVRRLLELPPELRPDAAFCFSDLLAVGAQRGLYEAGLRAPDDIALAGVDGSEEALYSTPSLTTVVPDKGVLAAQAVKALAARISAKASPPYAVHIAPHRLEVRESTSGVREAIGGGDGG